MWAASFAATGLHNITRCAPQWRSTYCGVGTNCPQNVATSVGFTTSLILAPRQPCLHLLHGNPRGRSPRPHQRSTCGQVYRQLRGRSSVG